MATDRRIPVGSGSSTISFDVVSDPADPDVTISVSDNWLSVNGNNVIVSQNTVEQSREGSITLKATTKSNPAYNGTASVESGYTVYQSQGQHVPNPQNVTLHFNCPITFTNNTGGRYRDVIGVGQSLAFGRDFGSITVGSSILTSWDGRAYCSEEASSGGVSSRTLSGNVTLRYADYMGGSIYVTFSYAFDICDTSSTVDVEINMANSNDPWENLSISDGATSFHVIHLEYRYEIPSDNPTDIYITEPISITASA